jgi:hypothetical protein
MHHLEVSGAVRHIYIYVVRPLKVKDEGNILQRNVMNLSPHITVSHPRKAQTLAKLM